MIGPKQTLNIFCADATRSAESSCRYLLNGTIMLALMSSLERLHTWLKALLHLPVAELVFHSAIDPDRIAATYRSFTRPHPTYLICARKTIGAAVLDLDRFGSVQDYLAAIGKRSGGGCFADRARARGYRFTEIDRHRYVEGIDQINRSLPFRQGKIVAPSECARGTHVANPPGYRYYGVVDSKGTLVASCELGLYGNFVLLSRLLGYRNNDGVMHFMIVEIVSLLLRERLVRYLMYDTWFGASEGLRKFKAALGFQPYRARYSLDTAAPARPLPRRDYFLTH